MALWLPVLSDRRENGYCRLHQSDKGRRRSRCRCPDTSFFQTKTSEQLPRLTRITNVLKLLEYDNLGRELSGSDREFAEFLFDNDLLQPPHVTFIDGKLHFEDSFLYGHDDAVLRVNRRKKTAEIRLEIDQLAFWIGYTDE